MKRPLCVIFSVLDGAVIDEETHEVGPVRSCVNRLWQIPIPLVLVSSKTQAEIESYRVELGHRAPYSAENGGLIVLRRNREKVLGRPALEMRDVVGVISARARAEVEWLSLMSPARASETTGLHRERVRRAQERKYSQPFLLQAGCLEAIRDVAEPRGFRVLPGKRFHHLVGMHDKGDAVREVKEEVRDAWTVGIGRAPDDVPLLGAVDFPIFLGRDRPEGLPRDALLEDRAGPLGWRKAVEWVLVDLLPRLGPRPARDA
jgi:mannosyl-3-phosphoglycerate phosphatase